MQKENWTKRKNQDFVFLIKYLAMKTKAPLPNKASNPIAAIEFHKIGREMKYNFVLL